jgi:hypothetical protein
MFSLLQHFFRVCPCSVSHSSLLDVTVNISPYFLWTWEWESPSFFSYSLSHSHLPIKEQEGERERGYGYNITSFPSAQCIPWEGNRDVSSG